jgi:hypothetical protein
LFSPLFLLLCTRIRAIRGIYMQHMQSNTGRVQAMSREREEQNPRRAGTNAVKWLAAVKVD